MTNTNTPSLFEPTIKEQFKAYHEANPEVYEMLEELAIQLRVRGHNRFGISLIWERLRWHYMIEVDDPSSDRKLNNNYRSHYARLLMQNPYLAGVFETRKLRS